MPGSTFAVRNPVDIVEREMLAEWEDEVSPGAITLIATQEVAVFRDAKIREFVPILALRRARVRVRAIADAHGVRTP